MGRRTHSRCDSHEPWHARARHRRKGPGREHDSHCSLRWRRPLRARGRKFAEDGLQKRPLDGWRFQGVESGWFADDEIVVEALAAASAYLGVRRLTQTPLQRADVYPPTAW